MTANPLQSIKARVALGALAVLGGSVALTTFLLVRAAVHDTLALSGLLPRLTAKNQRLSRRKRREQPATFCGIRGYSKAGASTG